MPIDFRKLVGETIAREQAELEEKLVAAQKKQREAEEKIAVDLVLREYVDEEVARDPALHGVWDALNLADHLRDGLIVSENGNVQVTQGQTSLLGLKEDEVLPTQKELKEFQNVIIPRVAQRIEEDRDRLFRYCKPDNLSPDTTFPTPLCNEIKDLVSRLETAKKNLEAEEDKQEEQLSILAGTFEQLLNMMLQMLRESFPIIVQGEIRAVEETLVKFQCIELKAQAIRLKLMTHIYAPSKVVKLKNIRYSLNKKKAEVETEFNKWSEALRKFEALGPEFLAVADDFKAVLDAIQTHEYVLQNYS